MGAVIFENTKAGGDSGVLRPALIFIRAPAKAQLLRDRAALFFFSARRRKVGRNTDKPASQYPAGEKGMHE